MGIPSLLQKQIDLWEASKDISDSLVVIPYAHHKIHAGHTFHAHGSTSDLDDNALRFSFITPVYKEMHLFILAYASGQAVMTILEAPTGGIAGGSDTVALNRNRCLTPNKSKILSSSASLEGSITVGASAGTGGTELCIDNLGGAKTSQAGDMRDDSEWVLARNTLYEVSLVSITNAIVATLMLNWYERGV